MVRTKAENSARKAVAAKAPRKALGGGGGGASASGIQSPVGSGKVSKYAGGNSVCERSTPDWQKSILGFCVKQQASAEANLSSAMSEFDRMVDSSTSAASSSGSSGCSGSASGSQESLSQSSDNSSSSVQRNGLIESDDDD